MNSFILSLFCTDGREKKDKHCQQPKSIWIFGFSKLPDESLTKVLSAYILSCDCFVKLKYKTRTIEPYVCHQKGRLSEIEFLTVYHWIYCCKYFTLSDKTSHCVGKCIRHGFIDVLVFQLAWAQSVYSELLWVPDDFLSMHLFVLSIQLENTLEATVLAQHSWNMVRMVVFMKCKSGWKVVELEKACKHSTSPIFGLILMKLGQNSCVFWNQGQIWNCFTWGQKVGH